MNILTGELIKTHEVIASYNGETLPGEWISDRDVYEEGTIPSTGAQVVYKLAEPIAYEIDLSTIDIPLTVGVRAIWVNTGATKIEYVNNAKLYSLLQSEISVNDVQINGTSIVGQDGVADITIATPDWLAANGEAGHIANKPVLWGGSRSGLTNIAAIVDTASGAKSVSFGSTTSFNICITGDPGATTYSYTGHISEVRERLIRNCIARCVLNGVSTTIIDVDRTQQTITVESTLSAESAITNQDLSVFVYPSASGTASFSVGLANASNGS